MMVLPGPTIPLESLFTRRKLGARTRAFDGPFEAVNRQVRLAAAFAVASVSDFLSAWLEFVPPLQWSLDLLTAGLLFVILGRQWMILPGLIAEAIPGVAVFPFWVVVVLSIAVWGRVGQGPVAGN
jgi:hypothetical protein